MIELMTEHQAHYPSGCPHCLANRVPDHHFRDTGDITVEAATDLGYCPVLAERRQHHPAALALLPSDAREAARYDEWADRLTADDMAAAFARAIAEDPAQ